MTSKGARLLAGFLRSNKLAQRAAADALGVSAPTLHDWLKGTKRPRARLAQSIDRWTRGAVPASSWMTVAEELSIAKVEPFEAAEPAAKVG